MFKSLSTPFLHPCKSVPIIKNFPRGSDWLHKIPFGSPGRFHHTTRPDANLIRNFFAQTAQPETIEDTSPKPQQPQSPPDPTDDYEEFLPLIEPGNHTASNPGDQYETFTEHYEEERVEHHVGHLAGPRIGDQLGKIGGLLNKDGHYRHSYSTKAIAGDARDARDARDDGQPTVEYFKRSKKLRRTLEEDDGEPFLAGDNAEDVVFYYEEDIEETNIYPAKGLDDVKVKRAEDRGVEKAVGTVATPESLTNVNV
ncbi:unnamed protein product [Phyllotreta striolata]|uniref:Uncharacterized protein n=1 Tax=Phyllotreta striolata TaxID=444603 RepID=A0A9N9XNB6_PHYSR|nr:unnamed protein product [Phyllotreta striolata]